MSRLRVEMLIQSTCGSQSIAQSSVPSCPAISTQSFTILSNGHGEDAIGARVLQALKGKADFDFQVYPTVDGGKAYEGLEVPILGPRQPMPSGGFLVHHPRLFIQDLRAGFLGMTWRQIKGLRALETDVLLTIGDLYALLLSSFVRARHRFYLQPLISAYHLKPLGEELRRPNRLFMERFSPLERRLMRGQKRVYVRDAPTAELLRALGLDNVSALGNPMLDALQGGKRLEELEFTSPVVALLPGSRRHASSALVTMLRSLEHWQEATGLIAWAGGALPDWPGGWAFGDGVLRRGEQRVYLLENRFADVLASADLVLGTAGTANEQAASLGLPVVAFAVPPLYTRAYLENQKRLLAEALTLAEPEPEAIAEALRKLWQDRGYYALAASAGRARMGETGGAEAIAEDILARLKSY